MRGRCTHPIVAECPVQEHLALVDQPLPGQGDARLLQQRATCEHEQLTHCHNQNDKRNKVHRGGGKWCTCVSLALTSSIDAVGWTSIPKVRLVSVLTLSLIASLRAVRRWRKMVSIAAFFKQRVDVSER